MTNRSLPVFTITQPATAMSVVEPLARV